MVGNQATCSNISSKKDSTVFLTLELEHLDKFEKGECKKRSCKDNNYVLSILKQ